MIALLPFFLLVSFAFAADPIKCILPIDRHDEVEIPLKGCAGSAEGVVFQFVDLPAEGKFEFRSGLVSADLPVRLNMELMTPAGYSAGLSKKIIDGVKQVLSGDEGEDRKIFSDVGKITFKALDSTMYVRVTAEYDGEIRADMPDPAKTCQQPLRASFVFEKLWWGAIPTSSLILIGTSVAVMLLLWLVGLPLLTWALGPQLADEAKKSSEEAKKKD